MKKLKVILFAIMCIMFSLAAACTNSCTDAVDNGSDEVASFSLKQYAFELYVGDTRSIETISEENLEYTYTSSRDEVASVNSEGLVTANKEGIAFITVKSGDVEDILRVTVKENLKYIEFDTEDANMVVNSTKRITASVYNKGVATSDVVTWTVAPECEYTIEGNSIVLNPKENGRIKVTATCNDLVKEVDIKVVNEDATILSAPVLKSLTCDTVSWDVIDNADAYGILIDNGSWFDVTENAYDLSEITSKLCVGESVIISVRAKSNENFSFIDSDISTIKVRHDFMETAIGEPPYSCTVAGTIKYDCKNCDREYTVENYIDKHNFVDGKCVDCGKIQSENVVYTYDPALDVYALGGVQSNYSSEEVYALSEYDDGIHGLKPVTYVAKSAFSQNTLIKKIVLPKSITSLAGGCFTRASSLEYLAMPGVVNAGSGLADNWFDAYSIKTIIVPDGFHNGGRNFFIHKWSPNSYVPILDVYVLGDSYSQLAPAGYNFGHITYKEELDKDGPNYMLTGNVYYYDETGEKCGQFWHYDEDGETPIKSKEHTIRENICIECGYIYNKDMIFQYKENLNAYACKRVRIATCSDVIVIPETYNDGIHGELPVTIVDNGAFGAAKNLTKVILPMSITKVYSSGFGSPNLEVVIMPGVTAMGDGNDINQFLNCTKLHTIVVAQNANLSWQTFHVEPSKYPSYTGLVDVYLYGEENRVIMSDYNNNMFTWNVYCYSEDETRHGTWWKFDEEGNVKKFTNMHNFVNGWCKCGAMDDKGVSYSYSPSMGGYRVIGYFDTFNSQVLNLDYYNDGINGEAPVIAIANNAFKGNSVIKELILSDSITTIQNNAFKGCENLVTVRMPKVTSISSSAFADCTALKNLIVNPDLVLSSAVFTGNISTKIPVLSAESGIGSLDLNISANTMLSGAVYARKLDTMPTLYHGNWWYEQNGVFYLEEKGAHDFSNGNCTCGAEDPKNFSYSYDPERGGYRIIKATLGEESKLIITDYDDGVHGELPIVSVADNAFSESSKLAYLRFPVETVYVGTNALSKLTALETLILPGITGGTWQSKTFKSNVNSDVLKHVVLGEGISISGFSSADGLFLNSNLNSPAADIGPEDVANIYRTADLYVYGEKSGSIDVTNNTAFKVYENKRYGGKAFYYSEKPKANAWYYDENGIPVLWADKTYYVYDATLDGYVLTTFSNDDIPEDGRVIIPDTYKGEEGEYPVVAIGAGAFSSTEKITYLKFPITVTKVGVDAIAGLSKLETLIMPGLTGGLFGEKIDKNFGSDVRSDVLKHVVVGEGFAINGVSVTMPRFMNSNDDTHDSPDAPKGADNSYRTAEVYFYGVNGTTVDVTNNTAFKVRTNTRYSDCYYLYSETSKAGFWYYDENGIPAIWEDATFYAYNEELGGYELVSFANKDIPEDGRVIIPDTYKGEEGEFPVVAVADNAFSKTEKITYLKFPETVVKIGVDAISGLSKLETLIMTGIEGSTFGMAIAAPGATGLYSSVYSDVLKHVVVSGKFSVSAVNSSAPRFMNSNDTTHDSPDAPNGADNLYRTAEIYYVSTNANGTYNAVDVTNNTAFKVRTNTRYSDCYYVYSETEKVGCWYYDENGVPTIWEERTVYELNSTGDGYVLSYYASTDVPSDGRVIIPDTYSIGGVELPVVAVGDYAFGAYKTLKYVKFPETVTKIGVDALAKLENLETLIMPGMTGGLFGAKADKNFGSDIKSDVLKHVVVGVGFNVNSVDSSMPRFMNSHLVGPGADVLPEDSDNQYRTAELYYYGTTGINVDVTNNTAFKVRTNARYSDCYYTYSATEKVGCWYYNEDGIPTVWEDKTVYEINSTNDGYVLMHFAEKDIVDGKAIIPDTYSMGGVELPVVAVGDYAFGAYKTLKYVKFPETVIKIGVDALAKLENLETLIMPGIGGGLYSSDRVFDSDIKSDVLKHVVVSGTFSVNSVDSSMPRFTNSHLAPPASGAAAADQENVYRTAEIYYVGTNANGKYNAVDATNNTAFIFKNPDADNRYCGCYYFYSETPVASGWRYVDGIPTPYTGAIYTEVSGGYELSMYIATEKNVTIPATYNGQPVVSVGAGAFGNNATIETVVLPESVTYIGTDALAGLTGLKTLVMPGITSTGNDKFATSIKSTKLESITAGYGFQVVDAKLDCSGASNKAKIFLVNVPTDYSISKVAVNAMTQYVKLISGEVYAYDATLDGYVLVAYRGVTERFEVPEKLNDGINGEKAVVKVGASASSVNNSNDSPVKVMILPETVTSVGYHAFVFFSELETLVMPGVVDEDLFNGSGTDKVSKLVVGAGTHVNLVRDWNSTKTSVYAACEQGVGTVTASGGQWSGNIYYYSATPLDGAWTYVNGIPTLWSEIA